MKLLNTLLLKSAEHASYERWAKVLRLKICSVGETYVRGAIIYKNDQTFHRELAANKTMIIRFNVRLSTQFVWRVSGIVLSDQFRLLFLL